MCIKFYFRSEKNEINTYQKNRKKQIHDTIRKQENNNL